MDKIDEFFSTYPTFDYDHSASFTQEFYRMCDFFGWDRDDLDRRDAREEFRTAMVQEFNSLYGKDRVKETHVNLVDLVERARSGKRVKVFPDLEELREYTISTGKFFPKENAYAGGVLKYLLREILTVVTKPIMRLEFIFLTLATTAISTDWDQLDRLKRKGAEAVDNAKAMVAEIDYHGLPQMAFDALSNARARVPEIDYRALPKKGIDALEAGFVGVRQHDISQAIAKIPGRGKDHVLAVDYSAHRAELQDYIKAHPYNIRG
ncbi:MAG: hypothetical protein M1839_009503 [Geoglossum umbratile]|nr:MAG: hypothetical protein M1839_009503 [Geoglossum umbratile]